MPQPTLLEILNKTAEYFRQKGIPNPRLDAQLLLGHVLKLKRLELYMNYDRPMTERELELLREAVRRRASREPLQYVLGEWPFRELSLKVDRRALVPRPETEVLVELARKRLPATARPMVLDLGVGTGAIFLSFLKESPSAQVYGVDISSEAIALCRENALKNGLSANHLFEGDLFAPLEAGLRFHLIVANPPYIGEEELPQLQPELGHEPRIALVGGVKGHEYPIRLLEESYERLHPEGILIAEIGHAQGPVLQEAAEGRGYREAILLPDYSDTLRFLALKK